MLPTRSQVPTGKTEQDIDGVLCVSGGRGRRNSVPSAQLCCEPKTALKGLPLIIIKQQYKGMKQMYKVKLEDAKDLLKVVTWMILSIHWSKYFRERGIWGLI